MLKSGSNINIKNQDLKSDSEKSSGCSMSLTILVYVRV